MNNVQLSPAIRDALGKLVRMAFMKFTLERANAVQTAAKPEHLRPWDQIPEWEKELDRQLGEAVYFHAAEEIVRLGTEVEQLRVQLAGCLVAAEGGTDPAVIAKDGDYGWSLAYQRVLELRHSFDEVCPSGVKTALIPKDRLGIILQAALDEVPLGEYKHVESGETVIVTGARLDEATLTPRIEYTHDGLPFSRTVKRFKERFHEPDAQEVHVG